MDLPGSRQLGLAKAFLQQYPWQRCEPHPEWVVVKPEAPSAEKDISFEPQARGIPGSLRIIYVPERESIEVRGLETDAKYEVAYFDPVTGETRSPGTIQADTNGVWPCPPPSNQDHDWVLVLSR